MNISPDHDDMVQRGQRARSFAADQVGGVEYLPDSVIEHFDEDMGSLIGEVTRLRAEVETHERRYLDVQKVLDGAIGTEVEDGAGMGLVADVALLAQRYADLKAAVLDDTDWPQLWGQKIAEIEVADLRAEQAEVASRG